MRFIGRLRGMIRNLFRRSCVDADETAEILAYIEMLADELSASGMSRSEAERVARIRCGGVEQVQQSVRNCRTGIGIDLIWQDLRFAVRQFRRQPLFTVGALVSLSLGIGAVTAIYTAVYSLLLRPLPFPHPEQLVFVTTQFRNATMDAVLAPDFVAMQAGRIHSLASIAGYVAQSDANLTDSRLPVHVSRIAITANLLSTLGVRPQLGRGIEAEEDMPGGPPVVLISDRLWRIHFGADSALVGKTISLNGMPSRVIGVMPRGFMFPDASIEPDIYAPAALPKSTTVENKPAAGVMVIARLVKGVKRAQADAEVKAFFESRARNYPAGFSAWSRDRKVLVEALQQHVTGDCTNTLMLLMACVFCLLLVTCANVANLQLARTTSRARETAVRQALGATRGRLIRQFLIENLALSFSASLAGLVLVWVCLRIMHGAGFVAGPTIDDTSAPMLAAFFGKYGSAIRVDGSILLFLMLLTLFTTALFGILPALGAAKSQWSRGLQANGMQATAGFGHRRFRHALLIFEVGASIALLSCAGLLLRSFANVISYESGFQPADTMTAQIQLSGQRYKSMSAVRRFVAEALPRLAAVPGIQAAALTSVLPLGNTFDIRYSLNDDPNPPFDPGHLIASISVSPDYFKAAGTLIIRGRGFTSDDTATAPRVLIVNRNLATRFFGGNALGKRIYVRDAESEKPRFVPATIVGVVEDVPHNGLLQRIEPEIYLPMPQAPQWQLAIVLRTDAQPTALAKEIENAIAETDRDIPVSNIQTMEETVASHVAQRKAIMALMVALGALAIILSTVGVAGVFAYVVSQRTREMGIRLALGASRSNLIRLVLSEAAAIINIGGLLGLAAALLSGHVISSMLVGIGEHDPITIAGAFAAMTICALSAAIVPGIRAARTDLLSVLRED